LNTIKHIFSRYTLFLWSILKPLGIWGVFTAAALDGGAPAIISVFAGRIADTGRDPVPVMRASADLIAAHSNIELLWASPRELLNIFQADAAGCHIITVPHSILGKLETVGKDLDNYSLDTVKMFYEDAVRSEYQL